MARICIITQAHLSKNPRVVKEANTLQKNGYDVSVITVFSSKKNTVIDGKLNFTGFTYEAAVNLIPKGNGVFKPLFYRFSRKIGVLSFRYFKIRTPYSLMYGPYDMLKKAKAFKADLYIGHTEVGLWVCNQLAEEGHTVAYDFEDWYSQDYISKRRPVKYLKDLERFALLKGKYVTCTSKAMADNLYQFYKQKKPDIIYNGFSLAESKQVKPEVRARKSLRRISLIWFSQTIGPGRGLEVLIKALNSINFGYEFHLRGRCSESYKKFLKELHQPRQGQELIIHPPVPHHELLPYVSENDVGLALEVDYPLNKDLTISNKILQYLQGGLTVISSETKGQSEVAEVSDGNVILFKNNNIYSLVEALIKVNVIFEEKQLNPEKSIKAYDTYFAWEKQEEKLLCLVEKALLSL